MTESKIITGVVGDANWLKLMARVATPAGHFRDSDTRDTLEFKTVDDYLCENNFCDKEGLEEAREASRQDAVANPDLFSVACDAGRAKQWLAEVRWPSYDYDMDTPRLENYDERAYTFGGDHLVIGRQYLYLYAAGSLQPLLAQENTEGRIIITINEGEEWTAHDAEVIVFSDKEACSRTDEDFEEQCGRKVMPDESKVVRRLQVSELLDAWIKLNPGKL